MGEGVHGLQAFGQAGALSSKRLAVSAGLSVNAATTFGLGGAAMSDRI
ncbi:MAG: hypothetical protein CM1200mP24_07310 [Gammaproteobacteria bacterium]|nr:MAG: hypothetical protein CM1200mP24_07310 [Gammaproteobacteria bacterium]